MEQTENTTAAFHSPISVRKGSEEIYRIYPEDSFDNLGARMADLKPAGRRIAVITDSHVEKLYLREVLDKLKPVCAELSSFVIQAGEEHKNLDWIRKILTHLIEYRLDRHDIVVALGGGVVGDMAGQGLILTSTRIWSVPSISRPWYTLISAHSSPSMVCSSQAVWGRSSSMG